MPQSATVTPLSQLQACIAQAQNLSHHSDANETFAELRDRLASENPQAAELLETLWKELLSARRSALFWQQICDVERDLAEQMAANHVQLQQNYLRLMQEQ
ncbi:hypothetical protein IQ268_05775 [Oculatella sp. LEGE 06141]|nr:hypothetical protein [Oculatella sp. LEGE 06141]